MATTKRIHRNDLEHLVTVIPLSLANGVFYPRLTIGLLMTYFAGRYMFTQGYQEKEGATSQLRLAGAAVLNVAHISTFMLSIFIGCRLATGRLCLSKTMQAAASKK